MSKFFINRPIVAIVISILTVIVGAITVVSLPVSQFPAIAPPEVQVQHHLRRRRRANRRAVRCHAHRAADERRGQHELHVFGQLVDRRDAADRRFRREDRPEYRPDPDADAARRRPPRSFRRRSTNFGVTVQKTLTAPLMLISLYSPSGVYDAKFLANYAYINLNDQLTRVPGIGSVQVFGAGQYAMRLWVKPDQLAKLAHHRAGDRHRDPVAEHREPCRPDRRRARSEGTGVHLLGPRAGPADLARGVRADRRSRDARWRDRSRQGRRPRRTGRAGLHRHRPPERQPERHRRRLSVARLECRAGGRRGQEAARRAEADACHKASTTRSRWTPRAR